MRSFGKVFRVMEYFILFLLSVYWTQTCPAGRGSARTELIGPCEVPSPTPHPKHQTRPAHREVHALPFAVDMWVLNVPQGYEHSSVVRRDLRFIVLIRED